MEWKIIDQKKKKEGERSSSEWLCDCQIKALLQVDGKNAEQMVFTQRRMVEEQEWGGLKGNNESYSAGGNGESGKWKDGYGEDQVKLKLQELYGLLRETEVQKGTGRERSEKEIWM